MRANLTTLPATRTRVRRIPPRVGPAGTSGSFGIPCGYPVSIFSDDTLTSYPEGIAVSPDGKTAYAVLNTNNTLTKIDLTATKPVQGAEVRVGQVPQNVVISPDGKTAYVSNEAGRIPTASDFQEYSNGTPIVSEYPTGTTARGTISVVDLAAFKVTASITAGYHPTGMAFWGKYLLVTNTYGDNISVIDTTDNQEVRKIDLGLPIAVPGDKKRPTARARTQLPSMRRKTSPTSRYTTPTRSRLSTSTPPAGVPSRA